MNNLLKCILTSQCSNIWKNIDNIQYILDLFVSVRRAKGLNIKGKNGELRHSEAITNMELFIV